MFEYNRTLPRESMICKEISCLKQTCRPCPQQIIPSSQGANVIHDSAPCKNKKTKIMNRFTCSNVITFTLKFQTGVRVTFSFAFLVDGRQVGCLYLPQYQERHFIFFGINLKRFSYIQNQLHCRRRLPAVWTNTRKIEV